MKNILPFLIVLSIGFVSAASAQKNSVSIIDFGAKSNDTSFDNSKAIYSAIDFAFEKKIPLITIPAGVFYITRGFNIPDSFTIRGAGIDKTILRLKTGLPLRTNDAIHIAIFTGKSAHSTSQSFSNKNISIKSLTIDLQKPINDYDKDKYPILGGIRLINPINCLIDSVRILHPYLFGIGMHATATGTACQNNTVSNSEIIMQEDWYVSLKPDIIPRSNETLIGIDLTSPWGPNSNGAAVYLNRTNKDYIRTKTRFNVLKNNIISGGSHGICLTNTSSNKVTHNKVSGCSNRGIILSSCCDSNLISKNIVKQSGSTAIHLTYDCGFNQITGNEVNGVLGVEGDGIKSYVNCNDNRFAENKVIGFPITGIRVSHGANRNVIEKNTIIGSNIPKQTGIKIVANNKSQYEYGLKYNDQLKANENICINNTIQNTETGILVGDEMNILKSTGKNKVNNNKFIQVKEKTILRPE